ncbi:hypothetical protein PIB30_076376, partial [Stylosanthes scabra]|nr:hypothetical protein [Stylosanthes scabra]
PNPKKPLIPESLFSYPRRIFSSLVQHILTPRLQQFYGGSKRLIATTINSRWRQRLHDDEERHHGGRRPRGRGEGNVIQTSNGRTTFKFQVAPLMKAKTLVVRRVRRWH